MTSCEVRFLSIAAQGALLESGTGWNVRKIKPKILLFIAIKSNILTN